MIEIIKQEMNKISGRTGGKSVLKYDRNSGAGLTKSSCKGDGQQDGNH
jgi:hypothetical protein